MPACSAAPTDPDPVLQVTASSVMGEALSTQAILRRCRPARSSPGGCVQERYRLTLAYFPLVGAKHGPPCRGLIRLRSAGHASCLAILFVPSPDPTDRR